MTGTSANSEAARAAHEQLVALQSRLVDGLQERTGTAFEPITWLRDEGRHGGGVRFVATEGGAFNRASVNISQVHYDDLPEKRLGSATALSTIIHPAHPRAPSIHMHLSWTEMRDGRGYWRMMADLNPAIPVDADQRRFEDSLRTAAPAQFESARQQGHRYFFIPARERHRGVSHFYLEAYSTDEPANDRQLADKIGTSTIDTYVDILAGARKRTIEPGDERLQLAYHTLYLFQVLTLDRGTTSGLLVHEQNDVGILGSLPSHVDGALLASWRGRMPPPQDKLLDRLTAIIGPNEYELITLETKRRLAQAVREHYQTHPEATALQASGDVAVPTVANHTL